MIILNREARCSLKKQKACALWMTGLSGSGKSTIARHLENNFFLNGLHSFLLDGDDLRKGLNSNLDFSPESRLENIRRVAEVTSLMMDAGLMVIIACISPLETHRLLARKIIGSGFIEIFVDTPLIVTESRDPKGLYKKARQGLITDFTGISAPYEPPTLPDIHIDGEKSLSYSTSVIMKYLDSKGFISF
jgi:adenylyl-sulfate kinase